MKKPLIVIALSSALLTGCGPSNSTTTVSTSPDGTVTKTTTTAPADTLVPPAPPPSPLTQANLDRLSTDMSKAEVEAILGPPTSSSDQPIPIVGGTQTTFNYQSGNSAITLVFKNDHLKEKSGTFSP